MKLFYKYLLIGLEKFDKRETVAKRFGYKILKYLYPKVYKLAYGISPYSREAQDDHDLYMENLEYEMRNSIEGGDYA
jgi:hypothetical protein